MNSVFQTGGSLAVNMPTYVTRPADEYIYKYLKNNHFCHVLTARQMGKSSLRVRTMQRLQDEGYACASIDMTSLGSKSAKARQLYYSFVLKVAKSLKIDQDTVKAWWKHEIKLTAIARMNDFFENIVLKKIKTNIVIFIDEIDSILSLDKNEFNSDDFFAAIRSQYNARVDNPEFNRLNFVIIGVATPNDLMNDPVRTPFNIGMPIHLSNFTVQEAHPLLIGFKHMVDTNVNELLDEIMYWSGGQPYLTQKLCKEIADNEVSIPDIEFTVTRYVDKLFLAPNSEESDHNLANVNKQMLQNKKYSPKMLGLYEKIISGEQIQVNNSNTQLYLQLSGIVRILDGFLVVANKIYEEKFNRDWIIEALNKINRPYAMEINQWLTGNKSIDAIKLKDDTITGIYKWSRGRDDLSTLEREFVEAIRIKEMKQKDRKNKMLIYGITIIGILLIVAVSFFVYAQQQKQKVDKMYQIVENNNDSLQFTQLKLREALRLKSIKNEEIRRKHEYAEKQRIHAIEMQNIAENERDNIRKLKEALRITTLAQQLQEDEDPTQALRLCEAAMKFSKNQIIVNSVYQIYRNNIFYKIIHTSPASYLDNSFSGDAKYSLSAITNNTTTLRDLHKQAIVWQKQTDDYVVATAISPNSKYCALAEYNNRIHVLNMSGNEISTFALKGSGIHKLEFAPDENHIAVCRHDSILSIFNIQGQLTRELDGHKNELGCVAFSPNGKYIATGGWDSTIILWNNKGEKLKTIKGHSDNIHCIAFSPDSKKILSGSNDNTARLWNLAGKELLILDGHTKMVQSLNFSPTGNYILTGSLDHTIRLWDTNGKCLKQCKGHKGAVNNITFAPNNSFILSASADKTIRKWSLDGYLYHEQCKHNGKISAVAISPDGKYIASASKDRQIKIWTIQGKPVTQWEGHDNWISTIVFSPNGKTLLTTSTDKTACLWKQNGKLIHCFTGHKEKVWNAGFFPDNETIVTVSADNTAVIWDKNGTVLHKLTGHKATIQCVAVSPDGKYIATGSLDNTIRLWNRKGELIRIISGHKDNVFFLKFSSDGRQLYSTSQDKTACKWTLNGRLIKRLQWKNFSICSIIFSDDGKYVFTKLRTNAGMVWDMDKKQLQDFQNLDNEQFNIAFSPDNKYIITGYKNNRLRIWHSKLNFKKFLNSDKIEKLSPKQKRMYGIL